MRQPKEEQRDNQKKSKETTKRIIKRQPKEEQNDNQKKSNDARN